MKKNILQLILAFLMPSKNKMVKKKLEKNVKEIQRGKAPRINLKEMRLTARHLQNEGYGTTRTEENPLKIELTAKKKLRQPRIKTRD